MKEIVEKVRLETRKLVLAQQGLRCEIQRLKWRPGSAAEVARLRSERDELGRRKNGKRALKAHRRPETGSERWDLWYKKRGEKSWIRCHLVTLGMLRGRAYSTIESKTSFSVNLAESIHQFVLPLYFGRGVEPYTKEAIEAWIGGEPLPAPILPTPVVSSWLSKALTFLGIGA